MNGDFNRQQGEYRAICLWKIEWQSFAKTVINTDDIADLEPVPGTTKEVKDFPTFSLVKFISKMQTNI